jgi:hypothetical protein
MWCGTEVVKREEKNGSYDITRLNSRVANILGLIKHLALKPTDNPVKHISYKSIADFEYQRGDYPPINDFSSSSPNQNLGVSHQIQSCPNHCTHSIPPLRHRSRLAMCTLPTHSGRRTTSGSTTGRLCASRKRCACLGSESVRIADPIAMKNLSPSQPRPSIVKTSRYGSAAPKRRGGARHVLPQRAHHAVWPRAEPHDVRHSWTDVSWARSR